jgi:hypothetical protein
MGTFAFPILGRAAWGGPGQVLPVTLPTTGQYRIRVRVEGFVSFGDNTCVNNDGGPISVGPEGYTFSNGFRSWDITIAVYHPQTNSYTTVFPRTYSADGSTVTYEATLVRGGTLLWNRSELYYCGAPNEPLPASSAQVATVTVIPFVDTNQTPQLALECTGDRGRNAVTRGSEIVCTASVRTGAGGLHVDEWSFNGQVRTDGETNSSVWRGVMVRGGTIQVKGKIGGIAAPPVSATIIVSDRNWRTKTIALQSGIIQPGNDARMPGLSPAVMTADQLGYTRMFIGRSPNDVLPDPTVEVRGGPNDGLYFLGDVPVPVWAPIMLNEAAFASGSQFMQAQERRYQRGTRWCELAVMGGLRQRVLDHENEHVRVYETTWNGWIASGAADALEQSVDSDASVLAALYDGFYQAGDARADAASRAIHQIKPEANPNVTVMSNADGPCNMKNVAGQILR